MCIRMASSRTLPTEIDFGARRLFERAQLAFEWLDLVALERPYCSRPSRLYRPIFHAASLWSRAITTGVWRHHQRVLSAANSTAMSAKSAQRRGILRMRRDRRRGMRGRDVAILEIPIRRAIARSRDEVFDYWGEPSSRCCSRHSSDGVQPKVYPHHSCTVLLFCFGSCHST